MKSKNGNFGLDWKNKVVLVTGGTGSFGHEFVRTVLENCKPKKLIVFSRDEMKQYEMHKIYNDPCMRYFVGDVRDKARLHRAFNGVNIVVHAAALKIVPTAEFNPFETIQTNVIGAQNVIDEAIDSGVEKVLALSTDKAASPINLYGATKLCAEKMFVAANFYSPLGTKFSVVRYGNVIGSRGSVVPFFKECRSKGVVPITDERMTRFWITLPQGVRYVLESIRDMDGGELFIPKLPSVKITQLAEVIAPGCKHKVIGIRPGEKIHEALVAKDELLYTTEQKNQFVAYPLKVFPNQLDKIQKRYHEGYTSDNNSEWLSHKQLKALLGLED